MVSEANIIAQTRAWIETVIVGLNFCPFARRELRGNSIRFQVVAEQNIELCLQELLSEFMLLDKNSDIETTLLIYPGAFVEFHDYLDYLEQANSLLKKQGFEGVYQLASFHPDYCFADAASDDPANDTTRSPYPMLHIIREASIERALKGYPQPERIPERNVALARQKGLKTMQALLAGCVGKNSKERDGND